MSDRVEQMEKILKERGMDILFARVASNLLKKGNTDEAVNICENGLKKYPSYAQAHFILASCYMKLEKHNEAKSELERTLKFDPGHLRALKMLSDLYQISGMEVSYKDILQKLHALDPLNDEITQNIKKLGIYIPWPKIQLAGADAGENSGKNPSVDKVDLSQFDNRDDDFTTILSGKTEDNDDHGSDEPVPEAEAVVDIGEDTDEKPLEYEELDELEFDKEEGSEEKKQDRWLGTGDEGEATEIIVSKSDDKETSVTEDQTSDPREHVSGAEQTDESRDKEDILSQPKIVSQTLGEILVSQKKYKQALNVFELLKDQHPENQSLDKKISFLKKIITLEQK